MNVIIFLVFAFSLAWVERQELRPKNSSYVAVVSSHLIFLISFISFIRLVEASQRDSIRERRRRIAEPDQAIRGLEGHCELTFFKKRIGLN